MTEQTPPPDQRSFFGRRHGHRLRPAQRRRLAERLPALTVVLPELPGSLVPDRLFPQAVMDVWLEIGFGSGEHLRRQASDHPAVGFIGCEPYVNGLAAMLHGLETQPGDNIRLYADEAAKLLEALAEASIGRIFLLFPDPWAKRRHHKRRFVSPPNLDRLARILKDGAEWRFASDHGEYVRWALWHARRHPAFEWLAHGPSDWRNRPSDWPATRYEEKAARAERASSYLRFRRRPRQGG
ncbi:MAG: tRNA (guanosine(46)-N7)-methyltransferase TrmB [Alphaproteobacteria bacterium]|nr:tRNA (guanosine(46)-N7)-methyltransferase TrmB [Alphaproteobacteria bacterium]